MDTFGNRIKYLRSKNSITQKQLADKVGIRESTLSRYENHKRETKWEILSSIANELNTNVDYLLSRTNISLPINSLTINGDVPSQYIDLIVQFDRLTEKHKIMVMERIKTLLEVQQI